MVILLYQEKCLGMRSLKALPSHPLCGMQFQRVKSWTIIMFSVFNTLINEISEFLTLINKIYEFFFQCCTRNSVQCQWWWIHGHVFAILRFCLWKLKVLENSIHFLHMAPPECFFFFLVLFCFLHSANPPFFFSWVHPCSHLTERKIQDPLWQWSWL